MFDVFYLNYSTGLFPHERKADSLEHACELSRTRYLWVVDGLNDYSQFDWLWEPVPWEADQTHVWPSQWQDNGGTYLIPKSGIKDVNRSHSVVPRKYTVPKVGIDHGNGLDVDCEYSTRYIGDYLGTLKRVLSKVNEEYVWVVSSVCDYSNFDFTWHTSEWQLDMLHVFPSKDQKFGDTFFVHVPSFLEKTKNLALLEWFNTIHFIEDIQVLRKPIPVYQHEHDSQVPAVWEYDFKDPVVQFARYDPIGYDPVINLWRQETKAIVPLTPGALNVVVPREAKNFLKTQLYDYPEIDKTIAHWPDRLLDIVFISNGEPCAERHWQWLLGRAYSFNNNINVWKVEGVNGRAAAYKAAANLSTTDWFFAVFAKLEVDADFPWNWQPDRLQAAKHYIFHAKNPVNNLEYGHQAMIAYNKQLVLNNPGRGLDFTLDDAHEVVPIRSGTAFYNYTPWIAWRTAFREVLKLKASLPNIDNAYRIRHWLREPSHTTNYAIVNEDWSRWGAEDAVEYYDEVNGDFDALKKSYEWDWLASYAFLKRNLLPDQ